ncbi:MAG: orotate phosphoribosyltransferase [Planctomycetes bacterium]|nr:orotate phosphoribosyltransferase [Planctomycetota bacterium]MBI3848587.1 orotate phosphoribosyltransferase [Planctomycetota bacterium]
MPEIDERDRLLAFLRERSYREGTFRLSSGATSNFYIDCKLTTYDPRGFEMIGRVMHAQLVALGLRVDGVGGLTMGADPIALAIGVESVRSGRPLRVFSVRKDAKSHGTKKLVEGVFEKGDRVLVIDDVITTGSSTLKAIAGIREEGGDPIAAFCLVDRLEGGRAAIEKEGVAFHPVFTIEDVRAARL